MAGWLGNLFGGGGDVVRGTLEGAGSFARDVRAAITGDIDPEKLAELQAQAAELDAASMQAQAEINKAEAQHSSLFVAGWRPFLGWTGGLSLFYQFLLRPLLTGLAGLDMPPVETEALYPIILGMLGLGGMRSWEKYKGVNNQHG